MSYSTETIRKSLISFHRHASSLDSPLISVQIWVKPYPYTELMTGIQHDIPYTLLHHAWAWWFSPVKLPWKMLPARTDFNSVYTLEQLRNLTLCCPTKQSSAAWLDSMDKYSPLKTLKSPRHPRSCGSTGSQTICNRQYFCIYIHVESECIRSCRFLRRNKEPFTGMFLAYYNDEKFRSRR